MRKSRSVVLVGVPLIAAALAACSPAPPRMLRVCKDTEGRVVDDPQCERARSGAHGVPIWWYMPYVHGGYPLGNRVTGGMAMAPAGARIDTNPSIRRGGFGESAQGTSAGA